MRQPDATLSMGMVRVVGEPLAMKLRGLSTLAIVFSTMATAFIVSFNIWVRVDPDASESRFDAMIASGRPQPAAAYGARTIDLKSRAGANAEELAELKARTAAQMADAARFLEAADLYREALSSEWSTALTAKERAMLENEMARSRIAAKDLIPAIAVYSEFLDLAGDTASEFGADASDSLSAFYAASVDSAATLFTEAVKASGSPELIRGTTEARLLAAQQLAALGSFYGMRPDGAHAAAGLLSTAYAIRSDAYGAEHRETIQLALLLGPVLEKLGRLEDAEKLYLGAFHAQEKARGANSPDLSLYIRLLAGVYQAQGRNTEAQALYEHMRALFRDAFGAQRYPANRLRDRTLDIDRPVSQHFRLPSDYAPTDLIAAARFSIPLSKSADVDEMKLRLAAEDERDQVDNSLPSRLAQLVTLCRGETGERLTLRSGYRSFQTQRDLYAREGKSGLVTPPGMSEHQLGLAVDIDVNGRLMRRSDTSYQCFEENAFRFGFILSYPPGNDYLPGVDAFEPWHWRYVGVSTARLYREAGPQNKPQEFLAALPCYQERALAGSLAPLGQRDPCLEETSQFAIADSDNESSSSPNEALPASASGSAKPARKLNNARGAGPL